MIIKNALFGTCSAIALLMSIFFYAEDTKIKTSDTGIMIILGYESCRLTPYRCSGGRWTDGIGNTFDVEPGQKITEATAAKRFIKNLAAFERGLETMIKVDVNQNVYDALVSFSYNVGLEAVEGSTLLRKLNRGDVYGACHELPRWTYSNGKRLSGLVKRRKAEMQLCLDQPFTGDLVRFESQLIDMGFIEKRH